MSAERLIALASIVAALASLVTIFVLLRGVRDQLRTFAFFVYTDRYSKIMARLPFGARQEGGHFQLDDLSDKDRADYLGVMRDYLNMCSEELWLNETRRIDKKTWEIWKRGIRDATRFPSFPDAWQTLQGEYEIYPEFRNLINGMLVESNEAPSARTEAANAPNHGCRDS